MGQRRALGVVEVPVPEGASGLEVALGLVALLSKSHGAVVTDVSYSPEGPILSLRVPLCPDPQDKGDAGR